MTLITIAQETLRQSIFLRLLRFFTRFRRHQEGVAAVELAICLIPLLLILVGMMDFAFFFCFENTATNASRAGVRYAVEYRVDANGDRITPNAAAIQTFLQTNGLSTEYTITTTPARYGPTTLKSGDPLTVTVTRGMTWTLTGFGIITLPTQVSGSTTMTLE